MPDAAKVDFFVRKLLHFGDDRKARDANGLGEGQELPGRQLLVAQKDDTMRQPGTAQRRQVILAQRPGQVEPSAPASRVTVNAGALILIPPHRRGLEPLRH